MHTDPLSVRNVACAFALYGLGTLMLAPEPSWHTVGIGLACLVAFGILALVPSRKPAARRARPGQAARKIARVAEIPPPPSFPALEAPVPQGLNDPHPAVFRGLRTRRSAPPG
ncbi:hypothetical protein [Methylobacterium flocculans]|uniref:hypothetical protein n=1 Tax=Methylobacterium flocculans TaxID=2984843 RepID=UPI0021F360BC|nr:hypothetical protein [Methylobacterium sp. FF17]